MNAFDYAVLDLPIVELLPKVLAQLAHKNVLVLEAAPGAGKSSLVPLALLGQGWLGAQKVLMLEPRRIAARATAERMAFLLGERVGETVGYQMRFERRVSPSTRIVVVTEGILTRMVQDDPALECVGAVIFDEFHERSVQADLGLALCLQAQGALREDLRLIVMSATLDGMALAERLDAAVVQSAGRAFPVAVHHLPPCRGLSVEAHLASVVQRALAEVDGDVLVFLPGKREIQRAADALALSALKDVDVLPLHGDLELQAQHAVLSRHTARRRVILATNIAETSLTIEGVQAVVDSGLVRVAQFDPASGMTRLVTQKISRANAEQRRGRAGRLSAGVCYRLWGEGEHAALMPHAEPEMMRADMLPLALELALWGTADAELFWLNAPRASSLGQARQILSALGALDHNARITAYGRVLAGMPLHPRLAHVLVQGDALGQRALACEVAALLSERDVLRGQEQRLHSDLALRVEVLCHGRLALSGALHVGLEVDEAARAQVRRLASDLARRVPHHKLASAASALSEDDALGVLLAMAYPERLAQASGEGRFVMASGRAAQIDRHDVLAQEPWLAIAHADIPDAAFRNNIQAGTARVFLAAKISQAAIEQYFAKQITTQDIVEWDARAQAVSARSQRRLSRLLLEDKMPAHVDAGAMQRALLHGIRVHGLACLPWTERHAQWRARVMLLRRVLGASWPDVGDDALLANLEDWLAPQLQGMSRLSHLERLDLDAGLRVLLDWSQLALMESLAPTHIQVPSGSRVALDYTPVLTGASEPILPVKLQELFGLLDTPRVVDGRVSVLIHLLSPAKKPLAVTRDLASFWRGAYQDVRKDMRGRYPRHPWPEDPLTAVPTKHTKAKMGVQSF